VLLQGREQGRPGCAGVNRIAFSDRLEHLPPKIPRRLGSRKTAFEDQARPADNWKAAVDEYYQPRRLASAAPLALALAVAAVVVAAFAWLQLRQTLHSERAARHTEVAGLQRRLAALEAHDARLSSRVGTAERTLKRRDAGIAPLAGRVLKSVFTVETDAGLGTGFVGWQDADGLYVITADHVVKDASSSVTLTRAGHSWRGDVDAEDAVNDLAVIRINGRPEGAAPLWQSASPHLPVVGDQVLLVGSPFGLSGTVTTGVVSRVTRKVVQTDAAANPGNSGGPAVDKHGRVVGVLVAGGGENLNFAIRIDRTCAKLRRC
jgi:S1-C subfamily serine protease